MATLASQNFVVSDFLFFFFCDANKLRKVSRIDEKSVALTPGPMPGVEGFLENGRIALPVRTLVQICT